MSSEWLPNEESWKKFLSWLDPNREIAAQKYEEIRSALVSFFIGRRWAIAEDLADEVINRVMQRGDELFDHYVGDPKHYFKRAAHNLHLDYLRKSQPVSIDGAIELSALKSFIKTHKEDDLRYSCLENCIGRLTKDNRELIIHYHEQQRSAKIQDHKEMADNLKISVNALRLRVFRIHETLRKCVTKCLQQ